MIRIGLADDQQVFRKEMVSMLNSMEDVSVILEAKDGSDLMAQLNTLADKPDLIILDLNMPGMSGVETLPVLKKNYPDIKVVVLSLYNDENYVAYLTELGADAYLFKDSEPGKMQDVIYKLRSS